MHVERHLLFGKLFFPGKWGRGVGTAVGAVPWHRGYTIYVQHSVHGAEEQAHRPPCVLCWWLPQGPSKCAFHCHVYRQASPTWGANITVLIAGLSNSYSGYIATFEEYQVQRFEGAATAYGPHTLDAYIQVPAHALAASSAHPPSLSWHVRLVCS